MDLRKADTMRISRDGVQSVILIFKVNYTNYYLKNTFRVGASLKYLINLQVLTVPTPTAPANSFSMYKSTYSIHKGTLHRLIQGLRLKIKTNNAKLL